MNTNTIEFTPTNRTFGFALSEAALFAKGDMGSDDNTIEFIPSYNLTPESPVQIGLVWMDKVGISQQDIRNLVNAGTTNKWLLALGVDEREVNWVAAIADKPLHFFESPHVQARLNAIYHVAMKNLNAINTIEVPDVVVH